MLLSRASAYVTHEQSARLAPRNEAEGGVLCCQQDMNVHILAAATLTFFGPLTACTRTPD